MDIIKPYVPKNFGKEYCEINGYGQYPMFMAVALGAKPCFDDWVDVNRYEEFVKICKEYNLEVIPDVIFTEPKKKKGEIVGGENITTTFAEGKRFNKNEKEGRVHVFVSKSKENVINAKKFGWYSVVINGRSINKPFVDHLRFGRSLGFSDCCVDFFKVYNNWKLYSHPYETFKNTPVTEGKAIGSYYCNNFLMDNTYFFIHNIPCSYRCENTIKLAKKVEEEINKVEPDYTKKTIELLKKPLLVFGERNFVIFDGKINNGKLSYQTCQYLSNPARKEEAINFFDSINKGNEIVIEKDKLTIMNKDSMIQTVDKKQKWFMIDFG